MPLLDSLIKYPIDLRAVMWLVNVREIMTENKAHGSHPMVILSKHAKKSDLTALLRDINEVRGQAAGLVQALLCSDHCRY